MRLYQSKLGELSVIPICLLAFFMPGEMAPINICAVLTIAVWLLAPGLTDRLRILKTNPIFWIFQIYFWMLVVGLLWTDDIDHGLEIIDHALPLVILAPALLTLIRPDHYEPIITAFLMGIALCVVLAHYNLVRMHWFPDWPLGFWVNRSPGDTAPFVDRVTYAPMLAWAAWLGARRVISNTGGARTGYTLLTLAIVSNLMFSGGRTGIVAFLTLLALFIIWHLRERLLTAVMASIITASALVATSYWLIPHFQQRVDLAVQEIADYENNINGGVSERIVMARHAWHLFTREPILGLGTGDYKNLYNERHNRLTPQWRIYTHPHNQFLYTATINGLIGLVVLLILYFPPPLKRLPIGDGRDDIRIAIALWMGVISLFGSYLWRSQTSVFFVLFACLAWAAVAPGKAKTKD